MTKSFLTKTRWLVTIILLLSLGIGNAWAGTYKPITSLSDLTTGDYVIVGQKGASSWGRLVYGTPDKSGRLSYSAHYTSSLPSSITTTTAGEIWHLTVSGTGDARTVTIYNAGQNKYLKGAEKLTNESSSANWTASYSSGKGFRLLSTKASRYLGVNSSSDYWRDYATSTLYGGNDRGGYVITLYKETHTVTYNGNGSDGGTAVSDASSPYLLGATVTVKSNTWTKTGYSFTGWNTKSDGSGVDKATGATFTITQDTTFYAQWEAAGCSNYSFLFLNIPFIPHMSA